MGDRGEVSGFWAFGSDNGRTVSEFARFRPSEYDIESTTLAEFGSPPHLGRSSTRIESATNFLC